MVCKRIPVSKEYNIAPDCNSELESGKNTITRVTKLHTLKDKVHIQKSRSTLFIFETPTNYYQNNDSLKSIARYFSTSQKEKEMLDFIPPRKNKLKRNSTFLQKQPKAGRWHPEVKQAKLPQNTCGAYIQINHSVLKKKEGFLVPLLFSGMFEHFLAFPLRFLTLSPFSFGKMLSSYVSFRHALL